MTFKTCIHHLFITRIKFHLHISLIFLNLDGITKQSKLGLSRLERGPILKWPMMSRKLQCPDSLFFHVYRGL